MNKESIAQVIYWIRSFTEDELAQTFKQLQDRRMQIGSSRSLREYLENLKNLGVLGFERGRYFLRNPAKRRAAGPA